jgi:outer membrane lipoprotein-sorting protein
MSIFSSRPALRWLVPVAVATAVVGGGAALGSITASAAPELPARSAAQLLVDVQTATLDGLSGTVRTNADLGLPDLPSVGGQGSSSLNSLASGSHTLRVWYSGPDKARVALLGTLGESDIIRNGTDLWTWDSHTNAATHRKVSTDDNAAVNKRNPADALGHTPQEAADLALKAIDPTTIVQTGSNARVAGRAAYELVLKPRDTQALIGEVRLAIDAEHHVPLRVLVYARGGGDPAYQVAFTQVTFARPGNAQFAWNPPAGTKLTEDGTDADPGKPAGARPGKPTEAHPPTTDATSRPTVVGTGWTTVVITKMPAAPAPTSDKATTRQPTGLGGLLGNLPRVSGTWGSGRLLSGKLFSVLLTDDGRLLAGAVSPQRLFEAARG